MNDGKEQASNSDGNWTDWVFKLMRYSQWIQFESLGAG